MSGKITYQGKIVEVVEFSSPDGSKVFEKARRAPGVRLIIPVDDDKILLTKEFRQELNDYDYRLPGGKVFDRLEEYNQFLKSNRDIISAASKKADEEALEEAGITVKAKEHFHTSRLGATLEWDLYYFIVVKFARSQQLLEEGEDIEVVEVSATEAEEMCLDGRIDEERSALVLLRYLQQRKGKVA